MFQSILTIGYRGPPSATRRPGPSTGPGSTYPTASNTVWGFEYSLAEIGSADAQADVSAGA